MLQHCKENKYLTNYRSNSLLPVAVPPNPVGTVVVGGKGKFVVREGEKMRDDLEGSSSLTSLPSAASKLMHNFSRGLGSVASCQRRKQFHELFWTGQ